MQPINSDSFPMENKARCRAIVDQVHNLGWPSTQIIEYADSYSIKAAVNGKKWTVVKLRPRRPCGTPVIYVGFSTELHEAEDFARRFSPNVDKCKLQGQWFCESLLPNAWSEHDAAEVIYRFLKQPGVEPSVHKVIHL